MNWRNKSILFLLFVLFIVFALSRFGLAADTSSVTEVAEPPNYILEIPIGAKAMVRDLADYIDTVYRFAVSLAGILAIAMIIVGGFDWVFAGGNDEKIGKAKERISGALWGLVIILCSWVLLRTINPALTELKGAYIPKITVPEEEVCDGADNIVLQSLSGTGLAYVGSNAEENKACPLLYTALTTVKTEAAKRNVTAIKIKSAYRSKEHQQILYDCYQNRDSAGNCPSGCTSCNLAAKPCSSQHEFGRAVDVCIITSAVDSCAGGYLSATYNGGGGVAGLAEAQNTLDTIMKAAGFSEISSEWWHYEIKSGTCGSLCDEAKKPACTGGIMGQIACCNNQTRSWRCSSTGCE